MSEREGVAERAGDRGRERGEVQKERGDKKGRRDRESESNGETVRAISCQTAHRRG